MTSTFRFLLGICVILLPAFFLFHSPIAARMGDTRSNSAAPPTRSRPGAFQIVAFGSSTTRGYGASSEASTYPAQLQMLFAKSEPAGPLVDVVNRGINGEDVDAMLRRLNGDVLSRRPNLIIWQLGSNDALHGHALETFPDKLRQGLRAMRAAGSAVILIGPQWNPDPTAMTKLTVYADTIRAVARDENVAFIDRLTLMPRWVRDKLIRPEDLIGQDGVHMTDSGYRLLAEAAYETILATTPQLRTSTQTDVGRSKAPEVHSERGDASPRGLSAFEAKLHC
ncbi:SGNH/GDSL hydrolase family protein [Lichenifustis flavocetrariae]|uniref:SGNH/GDSL hydrolase family protein n=1 Tax=Lichenifustis flavocetrariae TaxID=2949735 RepID=A0AA42CLD6_9HYPH|nr:SGNH/GDSL hydrolase family protein [Lichenifustis flavocetrariae]MCW6510291.1 SGNH/GDSL hydrolase family protein [Lichenifustis flavocetrariae]